MKWRVWRARVAADDARAYACFLAEEWLRWLTAAPGNRGAIALRRVADATVEVLVISLWSDATGDELVLPAAMPRSTGVEMNVGEVYEAYVRGELALGVAMLE